MKFRKGFTLIELLTVVLILSVLTAIAVPQYHKAVKRAQAANMLINLRALFDSTKRYYAEAGVWPTALNNLDVKLLVNSNSTNQSGEFLYTFDGTNRSLNACQVDGTGNCLYTLKVYYRLGTERDVYTCQANVAKYQFVCESLGNITINGETKISAD